MAGHAVSTGTGSTGTTANAHGKDAHAHDAHSSMRYWLSFGALFVFTVLTYALHLVDLGSLAFPIAMLIAVAKALVVILFFMHLWDHPGLNRIVLGVSILFLLLAIAMVFADTFTRFPLSAPHFG